MTEVDELAMTEKMDSRFRGDDIRTGGNNRRETLHPHLNPPPSRGRRCCKLVLSSRGRKYKN
jgi:hypothetical protein